MIELNNLIKGKIHEGLLDAADDDYVINMNPLKEIVKLAGRDKREERIETIKHIYDNIENMTEYGTIVSKLSPNNVKRGDVYAIAERNMIFIMKIKDFTKSKVFLRWLVIIDSWGINVSTRANADNLDYKYDDFKDDKILKLNPDEVQKIVDNLGSQSIISAEAVDNQEDDYDIDIKELKKEINDNTNKKGKDMNDLVPFDMSVHKLLRLDDAQLRDLFQGKSLILYLPVNFKKVKSYWSSDEQIDIDEYSANKNYPTIMFVKMNGSGFDVYSEVITPAFLYKITSPGRFAKDPKAKASHGIRRFFKALWGVDKMMKGHNYSYKIFISEDQEFGSLEFLANFFKPVIDRVKLAEKIQDRMITKLEKECKSYMAFEIASNRYEYGRTEWPWNFVLFGDSTNPILIVGKDQGVGLVNTKRGEQWFDGNIVVEFERIAPTWGGRAYRLPKTDYAKMKQLFLSMAKEYTDAYLDIREYLKKWVSKFVLGVVEDPKKELKQEQEEVKQEFDQDAKQNPAASNDPNQGNAVVKLSKSEFDKALTKMTDWHEGKRKQNVGACSPKKLQMYYKVCKQLGFDTEANILADEMAKKNVPLPNLNESIQDILYPNKLRSLYDFITEIL